MKPVQFKFDQTNLDTKNELDTGYKHWEKRWGHVDRKVQDQAVGL